MKFSVWVRNNQDLFEELLSCGKIHEIADVLGISKGYVAVAAANLGISGTELKNKKIKPIPAIKGLPRNCGAKKFSIWAEENKDRAVDLFSKYKHTLIQEVFGISKSMVYDYGLLLGVPTHKREGISEDLKKRVHASMAKESRDLIRNTRKRPLLKDRFSGTRSAEDEFIYGARRSKS